MSTSPFSDYKLKKQFEKDLLDAKISIKHPNILLLGNAGVGKSSLINTIFGSKLAETSLIKPQTRGFHLYSTPDVSLNIIDSDGYELYDEAYFKQMLDNYIAENFADETKQIHICWYCISISSRRVSPFDMCSVRNLAKGILPKVLNFEIAKTVENKRTLDEECPSSVSCMPVPSPGIYRYGRGVNFFRSCLLWCLAIPEIEGHDAIASRLSRFLQELL